MKKQPLFAASLVAMVATASAANAFSPPGRLAMRDLPAQEPHHEHAGEVGHDHDRDGVFAFHPELSVHFLFGTQMSLFKQGELHFITEAELGLEVELHYQRVKWIIEGAVAVSSEPAPQASLGTALLGVLNSRWALGGGAVMLLGLDTHDPLKALLFGPTFDVKLGRDTQMLCLVGAIAHVAPPHHQEGSHSLTTTAGDPETEHLMGIPEEPKKEKEIGWGVAAACHVAQWAAGARHK